MGKVFRSKKKAVEYLFQQDVMTLGKTNSKAIYEELLDLILIPNRVRKGSPYKSSTVYVNKRQKNDIYYEIDRLGVGQVKTFEHYSHLWDALDKTLKVYPLRKPVKFKGVK